MIIPCVARVCAQLSRITTTELPSPRSTGLTSDSIYVHGLFVQDSSPPTLSARFALILDGLCRAVAARMPTHPSFGKLLLLWGLLRRAAARFATLAERARTGMSPRHRSAAAARTTRPRQRRERLPEGFAWLVRLVPEAAAYGSQLHHLLSDPEMAALLAAAPQAGRILRPLCRMLAVPPIPALLPPPVPLLAPSPVRPPRASTPASEPRGRPPRSGLAAAPGLAPLGLPRRFSPA